MTEDKITILEFIISVLSQYEKEIDRHLDKLEKITTKLESFCEKCLSENKK